MREKRLLRRFLFYNILMTQDYETYLSPYTWRYGSPEMRHIWSETHKRLLWRRLWVALAEVQASFGLVKPEQVADLRAHMQMVEMPRALEIEAEIHHDLMAELKVFAEQTPRGGAACTWEPPRWTSKTTPRCCASGRRSTWC